MSKPIPLRPDSHRLSTSLPGPRSIHSCQACGATDALGLNIKGWQECDHYDQPERISVWLCNECSDQLIEPHVRLYIRISNHQPFPGAMPLCDDCKFRDGVSCRSPKALFNGGPRPGMELTFPQPSRAHINRGPKGGGWVNFWNGPVTACTGKEI